MNQPKKVIFILFGDFMEDLGCLKKRGEKEGGYESGRNRVRVSGDLVP